MVNGIGCSITKSSSSRWRFTYYLIILNFSVYTSRLHVEIDFETLLRLQNRFNTILYYNYTNAGTVDPAQRYRLLTVHVINSDFSQWQVFHYFTGIVTCTSTAFIYKQSWTLRGQGYTHQLNY